MNRQDVVDDMNALACQIEDLESQPFNQREYRQQAAALRPRHAALKIELEKIDQEERTRLRVREAEDGALVVAQKTLQQREAIRLLLLPIDRALATPKAMSAEVLRPLLVDAREYAQHSTWRDLREQAAQYITRLESALATLERAAA